MPQKKQEEEKPFRIQHNQKYFNISFYTIMVVLIGSVIIKLVFNWSETSAFFGKYLSALSSFFIGFFIAYLLSPLVLFLENKLFRKLCRISNRQLSGTLAIISSYAIVIYILTLIFNVMIPQLVNSCVDIVINKFPIWYEEIIVLVNDWQAQLANSEQSYILDFLNNTFAIDNLLDIDKITSILTNLFTTTIPTVITTSYSLVRWILGILIALIYSIYMLFDRRIFGRSAKRFLYAFFPSKFVDEIISTASECNHLFSHYITGKTVDSLIIGTLCFIAMNIFKMPYSMLISVIVGITNMIPYFGPWLGFIPGALVLVLIEPMHALIYIIIVFVLQQFDAFILGPKILGDSTGLRPVWILFSITAGGAVAGVLGMFLGVPIVAVIRYLITRLVNHQLRVKNIPDEQTELKDN